MISTTDAKTEARQVLDSIRRLVRALRLFSREAEAKAQVSAAQLFVLQQLSFTTALSLKDLAKRTYTDQSSVSTVVSKLVEKGLVTKRPSPKDQRSAELHLSVRGVNAIKGQPDAFQARLVEALVKMDANERTGLTQGLKQLLKLAGMDTENPEMISIDEAS
jgi:DNA-binding MarR family transcriptional regulator